MIMQGIYINKDSLCIFLREKIKNTEKKKPKKRNRKKETEKKSEKKSEITAYQNEMYDLKRYKRRDTTR